MVAIMRAMKSSGNGWIGDIPAEWNTSRVGLYFTVILGKMLCTQPLSADYTLEPYFCAADVHFDGINGDNLKQMWFSTAEKGQYSVGVGDLLIVEGGAGAGGCAVVDALSQDTYVQNSIMIVRPNDDAGDNRFLKYWIEYLVRSGYMDYICNIATIPHFTKEKVGGVPLVLPSDQHVIADFLDAKCTEIDALSADIQSEFEMLEAYKQSKVFEAIAHGVGHADFQETDSDVWKMIPAEWKLVDIKYLFEIVKRIAGKEGYDILAITQQGLKVKDISSNEGQIASDYSGYQFVYPGDFAMNHMDLLTGWVDLSDKFGVTSPDYRVFRLRDAARFDRKFYKYVMQCCYMCRIFYSLGQGVSNLGRWRLQTSAFNNFKVPVPPYEEQVALGNYLDDIIGEIDDIIAQKQEQLAVLADYKKSVIYEYVTGKKEVPAI